MTPECSLCMESFDDASHRPKILPCGHTFCLDCLSHRDFGKNCPVDRKPFKGRPTDLPDNITVLQLIDDGRERERAKPSLPVFWCRQCQSQYRNDCAEQSHQPCTEQRLRAELIHPQSLKLKKGVAAAQQMTTHLNLVSQELRGQLEASCDQLQQLQNALRQLQGADTNMEAIQKALAAAAVQEQLVLPLEKSARLLEQASAFNVEVTLKKRAGDEGQAWRASLQMGEGGGTLVIMRQLLLQLQADKLLKEVHEIPETQPDKVKPETANLEYSVAPVLVGLDCAKYRDWSLNLLRTGAPHLQELQISNATVAHLEILQNLTALRKLSISLAVQLSQVPPLPVSIEKLHLSKPCKALLLATVRLPKLSGLSFHDYEEEDVTLSAIPKKACGLKWLSLGINRKSLLLSLVRAHAATLEEVEISFGTHSVSTYYWADFPQLLSQCGFQVLRRLVLLREVRGKIALPHEDQSCARQLKAVQESLQLKNGGVEVFCSKCSAEMGTRLKGELAQLWTKLG